MKAIVVRSYGGPDVLKLEEYPDANAGPGEVLVRVAAASINPADVRQRAGLMKETFPIAFPGLIGLDVSGTVDSLGEGVSGFSIGDPVFAKATRTYAELCAVSASDLARVPEGMKLDDAAALPVVTITGNQLITSGTRLQPGQVVFVAGAVGNVGRTAVHTAKVRGAKVIAGVLKKQLAAAAELGADQIVVTDDPDDLAALSPVDAVADTVGGKTAELLIAKVRPGGVFASVLGMPANALSFPSVRAVTFFVRNDRNVLVEMASAVRDGVLRIPIFAKHPLREAAKAHELVESGVAGKVLLVVS